MTTRPSRPELRHSILARLSTYTTEVEWASVAAHLAFADSVIDLADWLAGCEQPTPARGPGASRQSIDAAREAAAMAVRAAKERRTHTTGGTDA